jgi:mRNA-degrading endonuclease RelE of RelBE toxin-antitoxin system
VRLPNPSANRGKSGGFRLIYYIRAAEQIILITLYSKTEQSDIPTTELKRLIIEYNESLED